MPTRLAANFIRDDAHLKSAECQSAGQAYSDAGERGSSGPCRQAHVEAKTLADLKIKAAVEGERKKAESRPWAGEVARHAAVTPGQVLPQARTRPISPMAVR